MISNVNCSKKNNINEPSRTRQVLATVTSQRPLRVNQTTKLSLRSRKLSERSATTPPRGWAILPLRPGHLPGLVLRSDRGLRRSVRKRSVRGCGAYLIHALGGSCALPWVMQPLWREERRRCVKPGTPGPRRARRCRAHSYR
jgi:hypothetical protein